MNINKEKESVCVQFNGLWRDVTGLKETVRYEIAHARDMRQMLLDMREDFRGMQDDFGQIITLISEAYDRDNKHGQVGGVQSEQEKQGGDPKLETRS